MQTHAYSAPMGYPLQLSLPRGLPQPVLLNGSPSLHGGGPVLISPPPEHIISLKPPEPDKEREYENNPKKVSFANVPDAQENPQDEDSEEESEGENETNEPAEQPEEKKEEEAKETKSIMKKKKDPKKADNAKKPKKRPESPSKDLPAKKKESVAKKKPPPEVNNEVEEEQVPRRKKAPKIVDMSEVALIDSEEEKCCNRKSLKTAVIVLSVLLFLSIGGIIAPTILYLQEIGVINPGAALDNIKSKITLSSPDANGPFPQSFSSPSSSPPVLYLLEGAGDKMFEKGPSIASVITWHEGDQVEIIEKERTNIGPQQVQALIGDKTKNPTVEYSYIMRTDKKYTISLPQGALMKGYALVSISPIILGQKPVFT